MHSPGREEDFNLGSQAARFWRNLELELVSMLEVLFGNVLVWDDLRSFWMLRSRAIQKLYYRLNGFQGRLFLFLQALVHACAAVILWPAYIIYALCLSFLDKIVFGAINYISGWARRWLIRSASISLARPALGLNHIGDNLLRMDPAPFGADAGALSAYREKIQKNEISTNPLWVIKHVIPADHEQRLQEAITNEHGDAIRTLYAAPLIKANDGRTFQFNLGQIRDIFSQPQFMHGQYHQDEYVIKKIAEIIHFGANEIVCRSVDSE
jgi:hypothetical protein